MMRVMRFGTFVPQGWRFDLVGIEPDQQWNTMLGLAKRADDNPDWESIWVYDHFHTTPEPSEEATHEAWSLMAAFGAATSRVRLGQMCTCMAYRNPAYLAKVAATIDVISGGRVEMGIGGGWYEHEWRAYGYGFPPAGERLGRLRDGVEIFRQMWTKGIATHAGKYYTVDGAIGQPRPLQGTTLPGSAANVCQARLRGTRFSSDCTVSRSGGQLAAARMMLWNSSLACEHCSRAISRPVWSPAGSWAWRFPPARKSAWAVSRSALS